MNCIADTGFIVAFLNPDDAYHAWALAIAQTISEPLLTCEAVLAEASYLLRDSTVVLALVDKGLLEPAFNVREHLAELISLAKRYKDRQPDLADLCLIRMSELFPRHVILTVDVADFRVYKRNKREAIPLITPPRAS